jgi:PD-(D/E)XK nuclease superfamily protein
MELTPGQQRTLDQLIGSGPPPPFDPRLTDRVRAGLEERLAGAGIGPGTPLIWLGKGRLNDHQRCEGMFEAGVLREGPGFEHSSRTAVGTLFHKAIEIDVATERRFDPHTVTERAAMRLSEGEGSFGRFWTGLDGLDRADIVSDAGRHLALFRDSFPPLHRRWAPQPELGLKVNLAGGAVVLSGAPDLVVGRTRRLVFDFKTGRAWPEHPEDMRFYALLLLLRTGVPPYRVATFFLDSGEWQAEDVDEAMLGRAAHRVAESAVAAGELRGGHTPTLTPGVYCGWCPRRRSCPAAAGWFNDGANGESSPPDHLLPSGRLSYGSETPCAPTGIPGATPRRDGHGEGPVRDRADPPTGRGPPNDVRPGHPARALR